MHITLNLSQDAFFCLEELIVEQYKFGNFDDIDEEAFWELVDSMPSVQYRFCLLYTSPSPRDT